MEKADRTFESQWHEALSQAEMAPPPNVWVAIDGHLANEQADDYKRIAFFYKWVAVACLMLVTIGGAYYWFSGLYSTSEVIIADQTIERPERTNDESNPPKQLIVANDDDEKTVHEAKSSASVSNNPKALKATNSPKPDKPMTRSSIPVTSLATASSEMVRKVETTQSSPTVEVAQFLALMPKTPAPVSAVEPWVADHLYGVAKTWEVIEEEYHTDQLWAGLSFTSGFFDPGFDHQSGNDMAFNNLDGIAAESTVMASQVQTNQAYSAGQSIAGGVNLGKRIARRVVVSGGVHYSEFNTGTASSQLASDEMDNTYALTAETSDTELADALRNGALTYEGRAVQLANEYQYLTIPIKAGYMILDKKVSITLNTGLSGNIRMSSNLVSKDDTEELNNNFNTAEIYKPIYFNWLNSIAFGYQFKNHYQFLLEPTYNQALTNFTSSENLNQAKPINVGLTIGFRYNF